MGFANSSARTHERVKHVPTAEVLHSIKLTCKIASFGQYCAQHNAPEDGTKPLSPPFVNMVDRSMDFLPPALTFSKSRQKFKLKCVRLDEAGFIRLRALLVH